MCIYVYVCVCVCVCNRRTKVAEVQQTLKGKMLRSVALWAGLLNLGVDMGKE